MRDFSDITDDEVKKVYENNPQCNKYMSWDEAKAFLPMYLTLKNQVPHNKPEEPRVKLISSKPAFRAVDVEMTIGGKQAELTVVTGGNKKPKAIFIHKHQIERITTALRLVRNCLQANGVNESLKAEAFSSLDRVQKMLTDKLNSVR